MYKNRFFKWKCCRYKRQRIKPDKKLIENEGLELDEKGLIKVDENNMTNIEGVFAGGDVSQNKATVCMAIKAGKDVAEGIDRYLQQQKTP